MPQLATIIAFNTWSSDARLIKAFGSEAKIIIYFIFHIIRMGVLADLQNINIFKYHPTDTNNCVALPKAG